MGHPDHTTTDSRYWPERIWQARQRYFDEGEHPADLDQTLIRSWERCQRAGLEPQERAAFDPVERSHLSLLLEREQGLMQAAKAELDALAAAVSSAGYAVLLTDARGQVLAVAGDLKQRSDHMRKAFRPGIDASEAAIGTSAMAMAIAEGRAAKVLGAEHYLSDNQLLHCCAAPVFDPQGKLVGTVDVTRDVPHVMPGVMGLVRNCAARIEARLFHAMPAFLHVNLVGEEGAMLAFDRDGQVLAASVGARRLIDLPAIGGRFAFEDLFEGRFDAWASRATQAGVEAAALALHGGIRLPVQSLDVATGRLMAASSLHVRPVSVQHVAPGKSPMSATASPSLPDDAVYRRDFLIASRAFEAGLPIMVTGATGVGKEVAARALHDGSSRSGAPFQAINCGAISPELIASELFGHVEGAYTGAAKGGSAGKIVAANGGTVLLDEIGDMPLSLQVALLRVLDSGEVLPVGASRSTQVEVRFLCATHRDLRQLVAEGAFREDLYFRLSGCQLRVPCLKDRSDFDAVLEQLCARLKHDARRIGLPLRAQLRQLPWPGNVRQLQHALQLAFALTPDEARLSIDDFRTDGIAGPAASDQVRPGQGFVHGGAEGKSASASLEMTERRAIGEALACCNGNVTAAARVLGISRATLYRKLKADPTIAAS
ncbi:sigma-54-dependent Fis family transcriptional regulator [Hydrogenophaga sp. 5NK40-0174]|uniref:sigma-54-dependent Fis family transcriptional regulator n=1 Tax=Hydrogenophaga sp. 5NK40-0174 TaxID=3127649 RepID=UPI0031099607